MPGQLTEKVQLTPHFRRITLSGRQHSGKGGDNGERLKWAGGEAPTVTEVRGKEHLRPGR